MDAVKKVYDDHRKAVLFSSAAALRVLLFLWFPSLPNSLTARVELSTATNSYKRLQEGLFLYERGVDPYDGGVFHQAPLLLPLFSLLPSPSTWVGTVASILLYTGLDIICANCLYQIAESGAAYKSRLFTTPRIGRTWRPLTVAAIYLFNPLTLLTCLGRPTTVFTTLFTLLSITNACQARMFNAVFALAVASYISLHPVLLLAPIALLCYDQICAHNGFVFSLNLVTTFMTVIALLLGLSRLLLPSWRFIPSVYLTTMALPDLTPNPGLWWYFFIEMFDAFREFFLGVFWLHMLSYSVPFCLRFQKQPLAAVILMMGVVAVFQPYANVGDAGTWLSCLALLSHIFELSSIHRYTFPAIAALLYSILLGPAFHHLWIYAGSGNANFFYAITLVWSLALLILLTDTVYSVLRDEWESERPEGKGKEIRQI
ncbi:hypothetical protein M433DRAFT_92039 [Acidomyces richmondensis BFW]|nr:MAG: hypothetical protein FE78DRAFT_152369 [Acidomyces sp. 'richmondensis']KYG44156.1 hypothetical protein M433DRAFT_92039 [Acidomyces richmondensis BFW]